MDRGVSRVNDYVQGDEGTCWKGRRPRKTCLSTSSLTALCDDVGGRGSKIPNILQMSYVHAPQGVKFCPVLISGRPDNLQSPSRLKEFLSIAGDAVDGAEFHGKGPSIYASIERLPRLQNYSTG